MRRTGMIAVAAALVAGILSELHGVAIVALATGLAIAVLLRVVAQVVRVIALVALAAGVVLANLHGSLSAPAAHARMSVFEGTVTGVHPETFGAGLDVRLKDGDAVEATVSGTPPDVGERVQLRGRLEPFDEARNPGESSLRSIEAERGFAGRLSHVRLLAREPPGDDDWDAWLPRARAWATQSLHASLDEPGASILAGAMWGEKGSLPPDLRSEFQDTGTTHVLITAGLHLGVVAMLAALLFSHCGIERVSSSLAIMAVVWLYALFSGAHIPSLRAATMISFGLTAHACGRPTFSWNALSAAALLIGIVWTPSVDSLSFALSFSCVAAIMLFAKPFSHALERIGIAGFCAEAIALTLATQVGTWPLTAYAFLVVAPYAPVANALVVPIVGLALILGLALVAATPLPPVTHLIANVESSLLSWIIGVVRTISSLPGAHVVATPPPVWTIALYDASCLVAALLLHKKRWLPACATFLAASALVLWPPHRTAHDLAITIIDVGQADAILIRTPNGHAFLVDGGGRLERGLEVATASPAEAVGERVVVPFLVRQGIHNLDAVLLSHPHGDHAGGIAPVLRTLGSDAFADSGQTYPGHAYHDALDVVAQRHLPIVYPRGGDVWQSDDGVTFRFYGPTLPLLTNTRNDINNNSLVFRVEYRRFRMLFTGDAGAEAEARILASGADLHADVLKVGHHGSAYSSTPEFIRAVAPRYAIISVGRDNLFGHPAPSTIATLEGAGARVYRTDQDGAITVNTNGAELAVKSFLKQSR
ncbi:MAG: DNA internalization-related competence protein ComEC/Rec2 [Candidatus Eremiobacteraeota bacterium]|nr:DNA internalization-related competence protein ComEC/Rec2 [Candidatus Eremiobacteraeota bacterium]